ncbi:MAG: hypothetical protein NZ651_00485 [Candidatus Bipolaricaulota bacterium]|nr:hypothetical protein [Candidatus Bipolaricaulota bacterium]MDW8126249.1 hypothetical protein [Candidatus Bipolaricaulota bacterium]
MVIWVVPAFAVSICQYQAPTTNFLRGDASLNYQYFEDPATLGPDISTGKFTLAGEWLVDSPARGIGLVFQGDFTFYGLALTSAFTQLSGTFREYPIPALSYFVFGGVEGSVDTRYTRPLVEARAGVGYGRFTDVTPLVRALRIEEKLLQRGTLLAALRESTLLGLAQEIGRQQMYSSLSDLAAALAKILSAEIGVNLDPRSILLIEEVLNEKGIERYCGWTVQFGLGYVLSRPQPGSVLTFNLSLQAAVSPDPRAQILFKSDLSAPYQVFEEYTLNLSASYTYRLNEDTLFSAQYALRQIKPRGQVPAGTQSATFQLTFELGGATVSLQVGFSKLAEARDWTQDLRISAGWQLW